MALIFRQGGAADLVAVYQLNGDSFSEGWSFEGLKEALEDGYELFVCVESERLAGYLLTRDILDEVHIMQIAVAPAYRRQGIAEQLSRALLAAKPKQSFLLEVRASNQAAQQLYAKLGFVRSGLRRAYYVPQQFGEAREDAVLMHRRSDAEVRELS